MKARSIYAVVLFGLCLTATAQGQAPMISYQGKLTDNIGEPLNATVSIQFSIYSQATGGSSLWTETQASVAVSNGIFNVLLGNVNPIPTTVFNGSDRWLGLKVGSDAEMSPRQQIVSVGYALMAGKANEADNASAADYASDADMVDGQHASDFLSTASDWGRSGVTTNLYEGTTNLSDKYVNETGPEEMTGSSNDPILTVINSGIGQSVWGENSLNGSYGFLGSQNYGVYGRCDPGSGVYGYSWDTKGVEGSTYEGTGVYGYSNVGTGVYGSVSSGWAGYFDGDVHMSGNLRIFGSENNGTTAALKIRTGSQDMLLDGNEIDALESGLYLNHNSSLKVILATGGGNVGIGTTSPGYKLDVAGQAHASSFPTSSDVRFKTNVTQLTDVLEKLEKIRGVSFEWNQMYDSLGRSTGHKEIGVIAQEVEEVFPELVTTWGDESYRAVDYGRLTGVLIEAIKELRAENESLKQRIEMLEKVFTQE